MAITNANQLIDINTINVGCNTIEEAALDYITCAERVLEAAQICSPEALSVDKTSMQPSLQDLGNAIATIKDNIDSYMSYIRNEATKIYAQQSSELHEYEVQKSNNGNN